MAESDSSPSRTEVLKLMLIAATGLATLGLVASCVMAWIPTWPWTLFEHFRVQYIVIGIVVLAAAVALQMRRSVDAAAIATLLHALPLAADLTASPSALPPDGTAIRVLVLNVHTESSGFEHVRRLIADERPDLLGLLEVDDRWLRELAPAVTGYAGRLEHPRRDNFGVALYARGSLTGTVEALGSSLPTIVADAAIGDARFRVLLTHPVPPIHDVAAATQERQLDAVARRARASPGPVVLMGDFNTTPWARLFAQLRSSSGLCDSRAGFGIQTSFPAGRPTMRIPIDHLFASCSIGVRDRRIGPDVGSDHLPVILDLVIPR